MTRDQIRRRCYFPSGSWWDWVCARCGHVTREQYADGRGWCFGCQQDRPQDPGQPPAARPGGDDKPKQLTLF